MMESAFSLFPLAHFCKANAPNGTKAINIQMLLRLARVGSCSGHSDAVVVAEGGSDCDFGGDGNGDASDAGGDLVSQFFATDCATSSDQAAPS